MLTCGTRAGAGSVLLQIMLAILSWKEEMGKVFIKTDVLGRPHWGTGGGLTSLRLAPALVFCPCVLLSAPRCWLAPPMHKLTWQQQKNKTSKLVTTQCSRSTNKFTRDTHAVKVHRTSSVNERYAAQTADWITSM